MCELIELLLIEIQKAHPDRVLGGQADDRPKECRIGYEEYPDAIFGWVQRTRQNRGEQKWYQRFYAVGYSIEEGLQGQIAFFPQP